MSQISLETTTKHSVHNVIEKAKQKFSRDLELELVEESECCVRFEGGGGFVFIRAETDGNHIRVTLEGQEWAQSLMQFMKEIA